MADYAELEIGLHHRSGDSYAVELRFTRPDSDADNRFQSLEARFDLAQLRALSASPDAYGRLLTQTLFADPGALAAFAQARAVAAAQNPPLGLRVRLLVGPSAPELHGLHWETLRDPQEDRPLCTGENLLFSRYLSSLDWRPVRLRPKGDLRALVAVAGPTNLASLAPIDVPAELQRARDGLGRIPVTALPEGDAHPTLSNLLARLRDTTYDILYLACHGILVDGESSLWLEDDAGQAARIAGGDLVARLKDLPERPRLIVLVSCQSAGAGDGDALAALGPRLAEAGIPAVLAMQGNVGVETIARWMPVFFEELARDGQIDRALAAARWAVRERQDYWVPALFTRLKSGRIWYVPGFGDTADFEHWESLKTFIQEQHCTPIIGPGLAEPWLGQAGEIARRWAEKHGYPFAPYEQDDLPRIAQYIAQREGARYLRSAFNQAVREELAGNYREALPEELLKAETWTPEKILQALETAAGQSWAHAETEAHRELAGLRLPIYVTTSPGNLLALALARAGAAPQVRLCPWWSQRIPESTWRYEDEPTAERPLVYHLFGHIGTPESLVLSEDNYFDFLMGVTRNKDLIPDTVVNALTSSALLFVGFRLEGWDFRTVFRMLMAQEGSAQLREYTHVSAQIEPEEGRLLDPPRARRFLEKAFNRDNISIYWGRADEFLKTLVERVRGGGA
jgi:hypothetical protein